MLVPPLRRTFVPLLMFAAAVSPAASAAEGSRPNILFIYADDHSPKLLSCYEGAYELAHTPNIDRLAESGIRFAAAYLGSWCMPSRASLLTGLHPFSIESMRMTGSNPRSAYDPGQCRFWPATLRENGYQTAQIGKWHTGDDAGWGRDWDYQRVWNRPRYPENAGRYFGPQMIESNGEAAMVEGYSTDNYTRWAEEYIRGDGRDADRPWYLWLCYGAIHTPTIPAPRHRGLLADRTVALPPGIFAPRPGKPAYLDSTQAWTSDGGGGALFRDGKLTHTAWMHSIHECLMAVDEGVGALVRALEETGQRENTLVIYTTDQGFANGEHGLRQKVAPYETSYASPFIASWPGTVPPERTVPHTVNAPDIVATFLALAGTDQPWAMPGRDFTSLLLDPDGASWDRPTLYLHTGQIYGSDVAEALRKKSGSTTHAGVPLYAALRDGAWKYVRYFRRPDLEELYDLAADPDELANLATDPDKRPTLERLRGLWIEEMEKAGADFLDHLPELP